MVVAQGTAALDSDCFAPWNSTPKTSFWPRESTHASRSAAVCALPLDANVWFTPAMF